jgi:6-phosphogluconolactonase
MVDQIKYHMYISVSGEDHIAIYSVDPSTGFYDLIDRIHLEGKPAPLAISPDRNYLYAGTRQDFGITSYKIDESTGLISLVDRIVLDADPCYLATDNTGQYLLSAYYIAGKIAVHKMSNSGIIESVPTVDLYTATGAHCIQTDPSNKFVFVPHIADKGPNRIYQFKFNESLGTLSPNSPLLVNPEKRLGPRHYCYHPNMDVVYFSDEQGCSVSCYSLDISRGTLTHFQTVTTLPSGYKGDNTCSQIQITPSGKYLYAPNRGHNSIACFSVNNSDGTLNQIGWENTDPVPRAFRIDPSGKFIFVASLDNGNIATYRIQDETGKLSLTCTSYLGKDPMWILIANTLSIK